MLNDPKEFPEKSPLSVLRQFVRKATKSAEEHCDLCGEPIGSEHRHLLNLANRGVLCACRACAILFDHAGAGGRRLIPDRCRYLTGFSLPDSLWESLSIPVNMSFFFYSTASSRVTAIYPSPAGPTESLLPLQTWEELERLNPILKEMAPDVEALLVNRVRENREYFLAPIDECYKLVGLIRLYWKGFTGGAEVWRVIEEFFTGLKNRSVPYGGNHA